MLSFGRKKMIRTGSGERIFYRSPDPKKPAGGVKVIYDHVDILNRNGFEAYVLHKERGFRCDWFVNNTKIACAGDVVLDENDYLVIPEIYAPYYVNKDRNSRSYRVFERLFSMPAKKVIFNQSSYLTFEGHSADKDQTAFIYNDPGVIAVMVVSEDSREYMEYVLPETKVCRIHNAINSDLFSYCAQKKPQICFMPRRNTRDAVQIINILSLRGALKGFDVVPIENMHEAVVARIFKESLVFLSLGYHEGFGLPSSEAMACGCIVIGYHGRGGREYFNPDFCYPVETGDIIGFARSVEEVIRLYRVDAETLKTRGKLASSYIGETYTRAKQESDVTGFWNTILGRR